MQRAPQRALAQYVATLPQLGVQERHRPVGRGIAVRLRIVSQQPLQFRFSARIQPAWAAVVRAFGQAGHPRCAPVLGPVLHRRHAAAQHLGHLRRLTALR